MKQQDTYEQIIRIFDVPVFSGSREDVNRILQHYLTPDSDQRGTLFFVSTPNTEQVMLAQRHAKFLAALQHANLALPDGMGLIWASHLLKQSDGNVHPLPERISGREVLEDLVALAEKTGRRVFLLGGKRGVAEKVRDTLFARYPRLAISSAEGSKDITRETSAEKKDVLAQVARYHPAILFVAYGAPYQEIWTVENLDSLRRAGVRLVMVVGGSFDMLSGRLKTAPRWISNLGFEWLWRLVQEPWRWKRQLVLVHFWLKVLREALR